MAVVATFLKHKTSNQLISIISMLEDRYNDNS